MSDRVFVTPTKRSIMRTRVGESVEISSRHAKVLHKLGLVEYSDEQTPAREAGKPRQAYPTRALQAETPPTADAGNPLVGVEFASDVAAELAIANGLTVADLARVTPSARGYTKQQVADALKSKGAYRTRDLTAVVR